MPVRSSDQPLHEQVVAAVAAERERIEAMRAEAQEHGFMRTPYPVWRTRAGTLIVIEGTDGMIIYDEGGHDERQAAHIAAWDPARAMAVVELAESLLSEVHVPHRRSPAVCRECMTTLPCPAVLQLADIWLPQGQEDAWLPEPEPQPVTPRTLVAVITLTDDRVITNTGLSGWRARMSSGRLSLGEIPGGGVVRHVTVAQEQDPFMKIFDHEFEIPISVLDGNSLDLTMSLT